MTYICGKHHFKTDDVYLFHLHIIDDHDDEHGYWQKVGTSNWTKDGKPWYGNFRYLKMYEPLNCTCHCQTGFGCWQEGRTCTEPERHQTKTPEEYRAWVDRKWKR